MRSVAVLVTPRTERNQVVRHIAPELAPPFHVMDLQILQGTAVLTAPAISVENLSSKDWILFEIQFDSVAPRARRRIQ